jgi:hypothetical protein
MNIRILLLIHAIITFAAGVVLFAEPTFIPGAAGAHIGSDAYVVCYLLGAAELAIAFLSFTARQLCDHQAVRIVVWTLIVFHACTAAGESYTLINGVSAVILANVAVRILVVALFANYGLRRAPARDVVYQ